jgi:very-short-patch-repair endonuclease
VCDERRQSIEEKKMVTQKILQDRARFLRKKNTDPEYFLWCYLRGRRFEKYKFRRQRPIGNYIVDFVCLWKKLIIEIDGDQHAIQKNYDDKRTAFLQDRGYKVIRFWNGEILTEIKNVLDTIWYTLNEE